MRRFSISRAMAVVALFAVNCAVLRVLLADPVRKPYHCFLIGLVPLLNVQIVGSCLVVRKYRILLRRLAPGERSGLLPSFVVVNGLVLILAIVLFAASPMAVMAYLGDGMQWVEQAFLALGAPPHRHHGNRPLQRYAELPLLYGAVLSGPLLVFSLILSWARNRYRLVIVARTGSAAPAVLSTDSLRETESDNLMC